jgi:hypothetical protein
MLEAGVHQVELWYWKWIYTVARVQCRCWTSSVSGGAGQSFCSRLNRGGTQLE